MLTSGADTLINGQARSGVEFIVEGSGGAGKSFGRNYSNSLARRQE